MPTTYIHITVPPTLCNSMFSAWLDTLTDQDIIEWLKELSIIITLIVILMC